MREKSENYPETTYIGDGVYVDPMHDCLALWTNREAGSAADFAADAQVKPIDLGDRMMDMERHMIVLDDYQMEVLIAVWQRMKEQNDER